MARLRPGMKEIDPATIRDSIVTEAEHFFHEGGYLVKRNGTYYFIYAHMGRAGRPTCIGYATSDAPMGPYRYGGVIIDNDHCDPAVWNNHGSIVEYKGQWYLFYHDKDLSPDFDKNRSIKADYLHFNDDGTIQKVIPTHRGVGISSALKEIQIDRYSEISKEGTSIAFIDPNQTRNGWKTSLTAKGAWVRYNRVDFGREKLKSVSVRSASETGGVVDIRVDAVDGPLLAQVNVAAGTDWNVSKSNLSESPSGVHDLVVVLPDTKNVEIDWVRFQ